MLSRYNPADIEAALLQARGELPFPPGHRREDWAKAASALGGPLCSALLAAAERASASQPAPLPATLWLECKRTGQRETYERPRAARRQALANLALAECLEWEGRFLDAILDYAWAICEESSWALPAHQLDLADVDDPIIDLGVAMTALELAELDHLLGERLEPALRRRIRSEVDRRCFRPYLARHDFWWLYNTARRDVNNWNAVCNGGVVGAAIYLEKSPARLAAMIAKAARSLDDYLATFDEDGGSSEGPGYWSYGFGYYTVLAHLVESRTDGQVSFLDEEAIGQIARYPLRTVLSPGRYVNFSDCSRNVHFCRAHLAYLGRRLGIPELEGLANVQPLQPEKESLTWALRSLFCRPDPAAAAPTPAPHDYFRGMQWMIARYDPADPEALVLAAKGGHNAEMHNQLDVGSFIVHLAGESLVAELGAGRYTRDYFGPQRYEHLAASWLGHSVPVANGHGQLPGKERRATLIAHIASPAEDCLALELREAYPQEAGLASLQRRIYLHREPPAGWVELEDLARFGSGPGMLESPLITFAQVELGPGYVLLRGSRACLRVQYDEAALKVRVEEFANVDLAEGPQDVRRVAFSWRAPSREGRLHLRLIPGQG